MCSLFKRASNSLLFQYHYPVVITVITTALLATVVLMLVQIAVCKCNKSPILEELEGGEEEEEEEEVYEEMGGDERGVAVANDPTYRRKYHSICLILP